MESKAHILVFPFPAQGHINPILQFSKRLASKGLKITLITTTSISHSLHLQTPAGGATLQFESISDGLDGGDLADNIHTHLDRFIATVSQNLTRLAVKLRPNAVVYDAIMPWCLDVARGLGLRAAAFFTQMCGVSMVYYHQYEGNLKVDGDNCGFSMPALPVMEIGDLPSLIPDGHLYPAFLRLMVNQFSNFREADWRLLNTFDKLEEENSMQTLSNTVAIRAKDVVIFELSLFSNLGILNALEAWTRATTIGNPDGCRGIEGNLYVEASSITPHPDGDLGVMMIGYQPSPESMVGSATAYSLTQWLVHTSTRQAAV